MKLLEFSLIMVGVLLNVGAQLLLKAGTRSIGFFAFSMDNIAVAWRLLTHPFILSGLACYSISVIIWIMALSRVEVSIAYPMLAVGYLLNLFFAGWLFGEAITVMRIIGTGIIIIGVVIVARS